MHTLEFDDKIDISTTGRTLDHVAWIYDTLAPVMMLGSEARYHKTCIKELAVGDRQTVLDIGCGTGSLTLEIAALPQKPHVTGIDAARRMIEVAKKKAAEMSNVAYAAVAAERLPFDDAHFDRAVSTLFYHHVDSGLKLKSLNEVHRVLKPGGIFVIADVDIPTTFFGKICAWSGYILFRQPEIMENIKGVLGERIRDSNFRTYSVAGHYNGYVTIFVLKKEG